MKKLLLALLVFATLASMASLPSSAAAGDIIYSQNFDDVSSFDELGYTVCNDFTDSTVQYSIENGKLLCDNLDADVGSGVDSYLYILDDAAMAAAVKGDYTIQYDLTYLEAEEISRYICLIYNYDGYNTYNSVHIRWKGNGNNQPRVEGDWYNYEDTSDTDFVSLRNTGAQTTFLYKLFGVEYDGTEACLTNDANIKDKTITVRIECSLTGGPSVYLNGVLSSEVTDTSQWGVSTASAIALKTSPKIKGYIDNIVIYEGVGTTPNYPVETEAPVTEAPADDTTAVVETPAAQTSDLIAISVVIAAAATVVLKKKR